MTTEYRIREALADALMDLRMDGPAQEGWSYQTTMRWYAARLYVNAIQPALAAAEAAPLDVELREAVEAFIQDNETTERRGYVFLDPLRAALAATSREGSQHTDEEVAEMVRERPPGTGPTTEAGRRMLGFYDGSVMVKYHNEPRDTIFAIESEARAASERPESPWVDSHASEDEIARLAAVLPESRETGLDVERLARAWSKAFAPIEAMDGRITLLAREYAALAATTEPVEDGS